MSANFWRHGLSRVASIFAYGVSVIDFVFHVDELPAGNFKHFTTKAEITGGGMGANAAVAARRLGARVNLGSRIGNDMIGRLIIEDLKREGIQVGLIDPVPGGLTSFSSVSVDSSGERQILNFRGQGLGGSLDWIDRLPAVNACLVDTLWEPALQAVTRHARSKDIPCVVDGEHPVSREVLSEATHLAFSRQGILGLTGESDMFAALRDVESCLDSWICATDGDSGVYTIKNGRIDNVPAFEIAPVNTLAAGDVWHGAFCVRLAEGADENDAIEFSNAAAAIACARSGGRERFPSRGEVEEFLKENA